ncbi:hypothetical protein MHY1_03226 [Methylovirgula sp. HY1]|nr:hypothetical protein MHY1_03226 [Methylovirgula sp. HY1]
MSLPRITRRAAFRATRSRARGAFVAEGAPELVFGRNLPPRPPGVPDGQPGCFGSFALAFSSVSASTRRRRIASSGSRGKRMYVMVNQARASSFSFSASAIAWRLLCLRAKWMG